MSLQTRPSSRRSSGNLRPSIPPKGIRPSLNQLLLQHALLDLYPIEADFSQWDAATSPLVRPQPAIACANVTLEVGDTSIVALMASSNNLGPSGGRYGIASDPVNPLNSGGVGGRDNAVPQARQQPRRNRFERVDIRVKCVRPRSWVEDSQGGRGV